MKRSVVLEAAVLLAVAAIVSAWIASANGWSTDIKINKDDLSSVGTNTYLILEPGYQLYFKEGKADLTVTVLDETKRVDGVETRIVEERETEGGKLTEVSRNYFAISKKDKTVYYFGEDVDTYNKQGAVTGHEGSWHAGVGGAKAGIMMPGVVRVGQRYYQEVAPKLAMDRAEIVSVTESLRVPAGKFEKVLKTEESTPLEPKAKEYKYYAAGVGLLKDGGLELVRYGYPGK
jgi:hypothetical protein